MPGLRYARNQVVHGVMVVDVAELEIVSVGRIVQAVHPGSSHIVSPPTGAAWIFKPTAGEATAEGLRGPHRGGRSNRPNTQRGRLA